MTYVKPGGRKEFEFGIPKTIQKMRNNMLSRCYYERDKKYKYYGGRGIKVCSEWIQSSGVLYEFALSHGWEEGLTIDRIDSDGNYEPNNVRFVPRKQNRRRETLLTYNNETKTINEWAKEKNIKPVTIRHRLKKGISGALLFSKYKVSKIIVKCDDYETITELSIKHGISRDRLRQRIAKKYPENLLFAKEDLRKYNKGRYGYQEK